MSDLSKVEASQNIISKTEPLKADGDRSAQNGGVKTDKQPAPALSAHSAQADADREQFEAKIQELKNIRSQQPEAVDYSKETAAADKQAFEAALEQRLNEKSDLHAANLDAPEMNQLPAEPAGKTHGSYMQKLQSIFRRVVNPGEAPATKPTLPDTPSSLEHPDNTEPPLVAGETNPAYKPNA